jgi:hypothetical protein
MHSCGKTATEGCSWPNFWADLLGATLTCASTACRPPAPPSSAAASQYVRPGSRPVSVARSRDLEFTGATQNLGKLYGSYGDSQSNCWVNLRMLD